VVDLVGEEEGVGEAKEGEAMTTNEGAAGRSGA